MSLAPSPPPDTDIRLAMPAGSHPMHGLIHPSKFAPAAFSRAEKERRSQFPNPCAPDQWDEWHRQHQQDRTQARLPSPVGSWSSQPPSRRGSDASFWSGSQKPQDEDEPDLPPLPWPPAFDPNGPLAGGPADKPISSIEVDAPPAPHPASETARTTWTYPLPPNLPLPTARLDPLLDPDENTVFYGAAYEYYSGSNLNVITSADFVPWDVKRQTQRERGRGSGLKETHSWMKGRGSKRHMIVFTNTAPASGRDEPGEQGGGDSD